MVICGGSSNCNCSVILILLVVVVVMVVAEVIVFLKIMVVVVEGVYLSRYRVVLRSFQRDREGRVCMS